MKAKKIYVSPTVSKTAIDSEISLVMMSVSLNPSPFKLLKFIK
jgi:hypothetical protein